MIDCCLQRFLERFILRKRGAEPCQRSHLEIHHVYKCEAYYHNAHKRYGKRENQKELILFDFGHGSIAFNAAKQIARGNVAASVQWSGQPFHPLVPCGVNPAQ